MKRVYLIPIVILSILALGLIGILVTALVNGGRFGTFSIQKEETIAIDDIENISLNLRSYDVDVYLTDEEVLKMVQKDTKELKEQELITMGKNGNTIEIKQPFKFTFFSFFSDSVLEIYLPKIYANNLSIKTTSGDTTIYDDLTLKEFSSEKSSGDLKTEAIFCDNFYYNSTSGDTEIKKIQANSFTLKSTSGDVRVREVIGKIDVKSTSRKCKNRVI